ncbi:flagellar hook-length control protein FliK [Nitrosomonas sp. sh817]|uniref:flagellar hook-length control protein FliK n=1 Tax=Nitrosomonas sp. sh817 TaxID=3070658 RepID=UPI0027DB3CCD|nr:flagellar hook-length control protein FliK [Nitrosomonas sp. sh817]WMJ09778.1 flagellar hook-length control protein FliK [Nitrosomonas sp. sh817]
MIPSVPKIEIPHGTAPPIKPVTSITPVTAITPASSTVNEFIQGEKYQAVIEARLLNGNSQVLVAGQRLQMQLPEYLQPGHKLDLVFSSKEPNLKFLLLNALPPGTDENISISTAGRFLGNLIQDVLQQTATKPPPSSPAVSSSMPILTGNPINKTELPGLLQKTIVQSGLFYESHQAQWINGETKLENLQQEPQGKLMVLSMDSSPAKVGNTAALNSDMPVHSQIIPLIQQQLNTLETGHLLWRGEVWQGQLMEWEIDEHPQNDDNRNENESAEQWRTKIKLSMPQLGEVIATIRFNSQGLRISLHVSEADTASLLKINQAPFTADLKSAGLNIQSVEVQHNGTK